MPDKPKDKWAGFESVGQSEPVENAKPDKWAGFDDATSTTADKAMAFAKGAAGGLIEGVPAAAGALGGGALGFMGGGPVGAIAGGVAGGVAGAKLGSMMNPFGPVESMPEDTRPYGYAGQAMGGSVPFAVAPVGIAATGARMAGTSGFGGFVNRILDLAQSSPKAFLAAEGASAVSSGVAGGISENVLPGQAAPRAAAEIAGGLFNVPAMLIGSYGMARNIAGNVLGQLGKTGTEIRTAKYLQGLLIEHGEDPAAVAKFLKSSGIPGVSDKETAAMKAGSPALASLEAKLSEDTAQFGVDQQRMADESISAIKNLMIALRSTGDPRALAAAAEIQSKHFQALIAGRLQIAERQATEAAAKISSESPAARSAISAQADDLLQKALQDVRAAERELWGKIDKNVPATTQYLSAAYKEMRNELLPNDTLNRVLEGFLKLKQRKPETGAILDSTGKPIREFVIGADPSVITSGELMKFRSDSLQLAREARAAGNPSDARRFGMLAEAALDDLNALPEVTQGLSEARTFSKDLNDTFTRTFAGDATAVGKGGRDRIPPELTLTYATGGGKEQSALRLREIESAMNFLPKRGLGGDAQLQEMADLQNRFLRIVASDSVDPMTGKVSQTRLANFIRNNGEVLNRFPDIKADLTKALSSAVELDNVQRTLTGATKVVEQKAAFAKFAGVENPADVIKAAVTGKNPVSDITSLAMLAKRSGQGAIDGLKASIWDDAIRRATSKNGDISLEQIYQNMFRPVGPNQPSLIKIMHDKGIINSADMGKAQQLFDELVKIQLVMDRKTGIETISTISPLYDLAVRMAGIHAAALIAPKGPGAIMAAGRASSFARNMFEKVPIGKMHNVLIQAEMDPKFAAMLLEKPVDAAARYRLGLRVHAYMFQAGLTGIDGGSEQ